MITKYTPGPWAIRNQTSPNVLNPRIVSLAPNGIVRKIIAQCHIHTLNHNNAISKEEAEANARLIAAAPELLETLEKIKKWLQVNGEYNDCLTGDPLILEMDKVIAKATGEKEALS